MQRIESAEEAQFFTSEPDYHQREGTKSLAQMSFFRCIQKSQVPDIVSQRHQDIGMVQERMGSVVEKLLSFMTAVSEAGVNRRLLLACQTGSETRPEDPFP